MKFIKIITFFLLLISIGCKPVFEDRSHCAECGNVVIDFQYLIENNTDLFAENINQVEVAVFDSKGDFVMRKTITKESLDAFQGVRLNLDPGQYRMVCWGNVTEKVIYPDLTGKNIQDILIEHIDLEKKTSENGEQLFYAPYIKDITKPEQDIFTFNILDDRTVINETLNFTAAYNTLEVYVTHANETPVIEVENLAGKYTFDMLPSFLEMSYRQTPQLINTSKGEQIGAIFYIPQFLKDNNILVNIITSNYTWEINLNDFIEANDIATNPTIHNLIRIQVTYIDGNITVNVPNWDNKPVTPEF